MNQTFRQISDDYLAKMINIVIKISKKKIYTLFYSMLYFPKQFRVCSQAFFLFNLKYTK